MAEASPCVLKIQPVEREEKTGKRVISCVKKIRRFNKEDQCGGVSRDEIHMRHLAEISSREKEISETRSHQCLHIDGDR